MNSAITCLRGALRRAKRQPDLWSLTTAGTQERPHGLILQPDVNLRLNVLGLIDNDFVLFHTILMLTAKSTTNYSIKQKRQ